MPLINEYRTFASDSVVHTFIVCEKCKKYPPALALVLFSSPLMLTDFSSDSIWKCIHLTCWVRENDKALVKRLSQRQLSSNYIPAEHYCEFQSCHIVYHSMKAWLACPLGKAESV